MDERFQKDMSFQGLARRFAASLLSAAAPPLDLSVFNDPLAQTTVWTPAVPGGANFCTHRLVATDPTTLEFKPTWGMRLFCFVFAGAGLACLFLAPPAMVRQYRGFDPRILLVILVGMVFSGVGLFMLLSASAPIVFDTKRRLFCKGCGPQPVPGETKAVRIEMNRIKALQIISEYVSGEKSSYYSYELNLVLDDASRVNVVDHGDLPALRQDADKLSVELDVPVWDADKARSQYKPPAQSAPQPQAIEPDPFEKRMNPKIDAWEK